MSRAVLSLVAIFGLSSCDEKTKPEDIIRYEKQGKELEALEAEITVLRAKVAETKIDPPEVSAADLQRQLEEQEAAITKLNEDLNGLKKAEKEAKEKLEAYRSKYRLTE